MTSTDPFVTLIADLHLAYPEATYGWRGNIERVVALWRRSLGDLPPEMVAAAGRRWIETEPKLPHISELRALIANAVSPVPTQSAALASGLRWIRGQGLTEDDTFGVEVMKSLGNRRTLGQMSETDLAREFGFAYRTMAQQERTTRTASIDTMLGESTSPVAIGAVMAECGWDGE